jgi:hypothetical protein
MSFAKVLLSIRRSNRDSLCFHRARRRLQHSRWQDCGHGHGPMVDRSWGVRAVPVKG